MRKLLLLLVIISFLPYLVSQEINFKPTSNNYINGSANLVISDDLDNDGFDDLIVTCTGRQSDFFTIYFQDENELKSDSVNVSDSDISYPPSFIDVGDFDNNGLKDFVVPYSDELFIFYHFENREFEMQKIYTGEGAIAICAGDLNNDGLTDIVSTRHFDNTFSVFYQQSDGTLLPQEYNCIDAGSVSLEIADMNNDNLNDLVFYNGAVFGPGFFIYLQSESGELVDPISYDFYDYTIEEMTVGHLNDDNKLDIAMTYWSSDPGSNVWVIYQKPDTFDFYDPIHLPCTNSPTSIVIADLDCNGKNEILVNHSGYRNLTVFSQDEQNIFADTLQYEIPLFYMTPYNGIAIGDFDTDERIDLIFSGETNYWVKLFNASLPEPDTIAYPEFRSIDSTYTSETYTVHTFDTVHPDIILIIDKYRIDHYTIEAKWRDNIYKRNIGYLCNRFYSDSLLIAEEYYSVFTDKFDTVYIETIYDTLNLAVQDLKVKSIIVYPNPTIETIIIENKGENNQLINVELYNSFGLRLKTIKITEQITEVDLRYYAPGIYYFKLKNGDRTFQIEKIILKSR